MTFRAPLFSPSKRGVKTLERQVRGDERSVALSLTAKPFFQSHWPRLPKQYQVGASSVVLNITLALVAASGVAATAITSFGGYSWGDAPWAAERVEVGAGEQGPFRQAEWNVLRTQRTAVGLDASRNILLTQLAPPVGQTALTASLTSRKLAQETVQSNRFPLTVAAVGELPLSPKVWEEPPKQAPKSVPRYSQNLFPLTVPAVGELPLSPKAWLALPVPSPKSVPVYPQNLFPLTVAAVGELPLSPKAWLTLPVQPPKAVSVYPQNLFPLTVPAVGELPLSPKAWLALPTPAPKSIPVYPQNLFPLTVPAVGELPFATTNWAGSKLGRAVQADGQQNLFGTLLAPAAAAGLPFTQTTWLSPPRYDARWITARTPEPQNLVLVPGLIPSGGSTVVIYSGVSVADGVTYHSGISRPNIALTDAGGGTYNVVITHSPYSETPESLSSITYLIDGELP